MRWLPGQLATPFGVPTAPRLNPRWVARGLVLVVLGDLWITPSGSRAMTSVNGNPARLVGLRGKMTGYGTTDAGNTTARLDGFRLNASPTGRRSYFGFCRQRGYGGGGLGRIFQDVIGSGVSARAGQHALWSNNSNGYSTPALQISDANNIQNTFYVNATTGFFSLDGTLRSYGFSCRIPGGGTPAISQVTGYVDGVGYRDGNMNGTVSAGPWAANGVGHTDVVFGNRQDGLRNFDGQLGIFAAFDTDLTDAEHASLHANPNQLLTSTPMALWAPVTVSGVTAYRPGSDIIVNGWTAVGAGSLAAAMADASTANYALSPNLTDPATEAWDTPLPAGTWDIAVGAARTGASGQVRIVCLDAGGTPVGTSSWQALTATDAEYILSVTTSATSTQFRIEVQA
jgi:hypothetical protein